MRNNLKRGRWLKQRPIEREETPQDICAYPIEETTLVFIQLSKIHKLNSEIPLAFFNHCHSGLQIVTALTCDAKLITLDL
jgi:hypothetical protein